MTTQLWVLIGWTLWTVAMEIQGLPYSILRTPGNYYCAQGDCSFDIDKTKSSNTATKITIYNVTEKSTKVKLISISRDTKEVFIEPSRIEDFNGTGKVTLYHADVTFFLRRDADCMRGLFECSIEFVSEAGHPTEYHDVLSPPILDSDCICSWARAQNKRVTNLTLEDKDRTDKQMKRASIQLNAVKALRQEFDVNAQSFARLKVDTIITEMKQQVLDHDVNVISGLLEERRNNNQAFEKGLAELTRNDTLLGDALTDVKSSRKVKDVEIITLKQRDSELKGEINKLRLSYNESHNDIKELRGKDRGLDKDIKSVKERGLMIAENVTNLSKIDVKLEENIHWLRLNETVHDEALVSLRRSDDDVKDKINEMRRSDDIIDDVIDGINNNETIIEAEIERLRQTDAFIVKEVHNLKLNDSIISDDFDVVKGNNKVTTEEIIQLIYNDTNLQQQINDLNRNDTSIPDKIAVLKRNNEDSNSTIIEMRQANTVLNERTANLSLKYFEIMRLAFVLREENSALESSIDILLERIEALQRVQNFSLSLDGNN